jgi:hypothetical protein
MWKGLSEADKELMVNWDDMPSKLTEISYKLFNERPQILIDKNSPLSVPVSLPQQTLYLLSLMVQSLYVLGKKEHKVSLKPWDVINNDHSEFLRVSCSMESMVWQSTDRDKRFSTLVDTDQETSACPIGAFILISYFLIIKWGGDFLIPTSSDNNIMIHLPLSIKTDNDLPIRNPPDILNKIFSYHTKWNS